LIHWMSTIIINFMCNFPFNRLDSFASMHPISSS
jgi:hypothetical protein